MVSELVDSPSFTFPCFLFPFLFSFIFAFWFFNFPHFSFYSIPPVVLIFHLSHIFVWSSFFDSCDFDFHYFLFHVFQKKLFRVVIVSISLHFSFFCFFFSSFPSCFCTVSRLRVFCVLRFSHLLLVFLFHFLFGSRCQKSIFRNKEPKIKQVFGRFRTPVVSTSSRTFEDGQICNRIGGTAARTYNPKKKC